MDLSLLPGHGSSSLGYVVSAGSDGFTYREMTYPIVLKRSYSVYHTHKVDFLSIVVFSTAV